MGINIITEHRTQDGRSDKLIALLRVLLPESLKHGGAEEISIRQNQDDPTDIISVQRWVSRQAYVDYFAWRTDKGVAAQIEEMLERPVTIRFFDEILHGVLADKDMAMKAHGSLGGADPREGRLKTGINILTEFKTQPDRLEDLKALLQELLPQSLEHGGAEEICIRQNQDDPNDVVSAQRWTSREVYLSYRKWRSDGGTTARIQEMLNAPINVRFFNEIIFGAPSAELSHHFPKQAAQPAAAPADSNVRYPLD